MWNAMMNKLATTIVTAAMVVVLLLGATCSTSAAPISHIGFAFDVSGSVMENVAEVSTARVTDRNERKLLNRRAKSEVIFME